MAEDTQLSGYVVMKDNLDISFCLQWLPWIFTQLSVCDEQLYPYPYPFAGRGMEACE
jgi:hypothetical protein